MGEAVGCALRGTTNPDDESRSFQFVVMGAVKQIAQSQRAGGRTGEIGDSPSRAASEDPGNGIVFSASSWAGQVTLGCGEISGSSRGHGSGQQNVFSIPETNVG